MNRWLGAGLIVMLAGILFWVLAPTGEVVAKAPPVQEIRSEPAPIEREPEPVKHLKPVKPVKPEPEVAEDDEAPPPGQLDPESDAFIELIDEIIPRRLYGAITDACYEQGLPDHEKIKLGVKLRSISGQFQVRDVWIMKSNVTNKTLESCIVDAVRNAHWAAAEMPDWEDEDELFIRLGGMKKYLDE